MKVFLQCFLWLGTRGLRVDMDWEGENENG